MERTMQALQSGATFAPLAAASSSCSDGALPQPGSGRLQAAAGTPKPSHRSCEAWEALSSSSSTFTTRKQQQFLRSPSVPSAKHRTCRGPRPLPPVAQAFVDDVPVHHARIKVIGVGGGGGNAVNRMIASGLQGVEYWVLNTDQQALLQSAATNRLQIGADLTRGLGTGGKPELGERAATESKEELAAAVRGADLVFITAGMGGGTGSGGAPVVAELSKEAGALTVGVVTYPFKFEGSRRAKQATGAIEELRRVVDTLIIIPNDRLLQTVADLKLQDAFMMADDVLRQGVQGISDIITIPGMINIDFADVSAVMSQSGTAMLGTGMSTGKDRATKAADAAIRAPMMENTIEKATGIVFNVTGGRDMTLQEVNEAAEVVTNVADPDCNIIFGSVIDEKYDGEVHVTIIATGFDPSFQEALLNPAARARAIVPSPLPEPPQPTLPSRFGLGGRGRGFL